MDNDDLNLEIQKVLVQSLTSAHNEGLTKTNLSFLSFIRFNSPQPLNRGIITPSFCVLLQGKKEVHMGAEVVQYGPGHYLASVIDMPSAGQVIGATKLKPYVGLKIDFTPEELRTVALEAKIEVKSKEKVSPAAFIAKSSTELMEVLFKLVKLSNKKEDSTFLAQTLKKEMIYHLLTSDYGHLFYEHLQVDHHNEAIGRAVEWIKQNFDRAFTVKELAKASSMSVSSLHHKFKAVTTMGPLQYQKRLRLQHARRLLMEGKLDVTAAAFEVGYESATQFNREYRRLFGLPPLKDMKHIRNIILAS